MNQPSLFIAFLTGITAGGLTCLALQGSLLASTYVNQKNFYKPTFLFLISKLFAHTLLGFFLGLISSSLSMSTITRGWLQIVLSIYLLGVAGSLLNLHPLFRYFIFTPPKFIAKQLRNSSRNQTSLTPVILGLLTVFIPCATTQAMEIVAISTGNPVLSSAIMFCFTLGTFPSFLAFSFILQKGSQTSQKYFPLIGGILLFVMSLFNLNNGIGLTGSVYTLQNFWQVATHRTNTSTKSVLGINTQTATINISNQGYSPNNITLKKGVPTYLELITNNVSNCSRSFTIPDLNIEQLLPETGKTILEFTPDKIGLLAFSCSMGMYTGQFNIVN